MGKPIRRLIAAASAALTIGTGAAVWATSSASAAPAAPASSTPQCTAADLDVWLNLGPVGAAAGLENSVQLLEFTNASNRACHLSGYPGLSALDAHGKQIGKAAGRDTEFKATTVTIAAGGTAHAEVDWVASGLSPAIKCKPTTATFIRVVPPGAKHSDFGFAPLPSCSAKGVTYLHVTTVRPGLNFEK